MIGTILAVFVSTESTHLARARLLINGVWDMLFGTYKNPKEWTQTCGFDADMEERLGAMLVFRDASL